MHEKKLKKIAIVILTLMDALFLVISVLNWDMMLSICCFVLAILLTYLYEDVGFGEFYYGKRMRKEYREAKRAARKEKK